MVRFRFTAGAGIFLFATVSRTALEPTQLSIHPVEGFWCEGHNYLPPSSDGISNAWASVLLLWPQDFVLRRRDCFTTYISLWIYRPCKSVPIL